ncbi:MAG: polyprenyl synthetase family protein [Paludibacteraceae bacterium]|nr:polyprenyl synthetase family protein [Paludibacteraceae bacterium]
MSLSEIKAPIQDSFLLFQRTYNDVLNSANPSLNLLLEHTKQSQGKQMRPLLVLLTAGICGGITQSTIHSAVALELLHAASLVHDDVVDDSDERRGMPSLKAIFNNKVSILGGDYMLSTALQEAAKTENVGVFKTLATLGQQLSEGEIYQMENTKQKLFDENAYINVIRHKTAALFAACGKIGAITSNNTDMEKELRVTALGEQIGLCFQIKDDIFDFNPSAQTGKTACKDLLEGKITLPLIYVYNNADTTVKTAILSALDEGDVNYLQKAARDMGGIDYAQKRLEAMQQRAFEMVDIFPQSRYTAALRTYIDYMSKRKN